MFTVLTVGAIIGIVIGMLQRFCSYGNMLGVPFYDQTNRL